MSCFRLFVLLQLNFLCPAADAGAVELSAYAGKSPLEEVDGVSFYEHPAVAREIVERSGDEALDLVQGFETAIPIVLQDGVLIAISCERGNCANANAAAAVTPQGKLVALCLYDSAGRHGAPATKVRWAGERLDRMMPKDPASTGCPGDPSEFLEAYTQAITR